MEALKNYHNNSNFQTIINGINILNVNREIIQNIARTNTLLFAL